MYQKLLSLIFLTFIGLSFVASLYFPCHPAQFELKFASKLSKLSGFYTTVLVYFVNRRGKTLL